MAPHQAPLSLGFSRQEHWSGLPFTSPVHESEKWKWSHSRVQLSVTPWTAAYQAPPSMGFSRQEYWSGVPSPSLHVGTICTHLLALRSRHLEAFWVALESPLHLFFSFKPLSCVPVVSWIKTFCSVVPLAFFWFKASVKERKHSAWFWNYSSVNSLQLMFSVIVECFLDLLLRFKIVWFLVVG